MALKLKWWFARSNGRKSAHKAFVGACLDTTVHIQRPINDGAAVRGRVIRERQTERRCEEDAFPSARLTESSAEWSCRLLKNLVCSSSSSM